MQATFEDKVTAILSASVPSCARKRSPDAAPSLRQTVRDSRKCAPQGRKRECLRITRHQSSPQEDAFASETSWPEATVRQCGPHACSSPARTKLPADEIEHGPNVSGHDSRANNVRARKPRSKRARRKSRRKRPKVLSQEGRSARSNNTPGVAIVRSPEGDP